MNPVLLKPTGEHASQVVVMGRPVGVRDAGRYQRPSKRSSASSTPRCRRSAPASTSSSARAPAARPRSTCCGTTSSTSAWRGAPASRPWWSGTSSAAGSSRTCSARSALLPGELSSLVRGFVDQPVPWGPRAAGRCDGRTGGPLRRPDARCPAAPRGVGSSMPRTRWPCRRPSGPPPPGSAGLDVAAIRLPRLSNFTDLDPLVAEPDVRVRWVDHAGALGDPDLVVVGGTRATVDDLRWLRDSGLAERAGDPAARPRAPRDRRPLRWVPDDGRGARRPRGRRVLGAGDDRAGLAARCARCTRPTSSFVSRSARPTTAQWCAGTRSGTGASSPGPAACPGSPVRTRATPWACVMRRARSWARRCTVSSRRTRSGRSSSASSPARRGRAWRPSRYVLRRGTRAPDRPHRRRL